MGIGRSSKRGSAAPGSADVPVGKNPELDRQSLAAEEDVGAPRGWHSRGYLPHCDSPHHIQSITYRLSDSLPREKLEQLEIELQALPSARRDAARRQKIEAWLDAGMGCCALRHPKIARYVQDSFLHFHGERYHLHAWCVMPNHVHVLIQPLSDLALIVQGWKSFTARWILRNRTALGLEIPAGGTVWVREYWDRYIRDEDHYWTVIEYIHHNPVKAGLCASPEAWPWSSGSVPGSADVLVGKSSSLAVPGSDHKIQRADEDVGAPRGGAPAQPTDTTT